MRIVQLTDLHLVADPQGRVRRAEVRTEFRRALRAARLLEPDYYVLTGDLTQDEKPESYEALREMLGDVTPRTVVLPGNHDDAGALARVFPECTGAPGRVGFSQDAGAWHLLGVDTRVGGRILGRVGADQLAWLDQELAAGEKPAILFMHHPPIQLMTRWLDATRLEDAEALAELARRRPRLRAIACGHAHMEAQGRLGEVDVFVTPSTAFQFIRGSWWPRVTHPGGAFRSFDLSTHIRTEVVRTP